MTKIRKKTKYSIKDLAIYRLRYLNGYGYNWVLINQQNYSNEIFQKNNNTATFFVVNLVDPNKPILSRYTDIESERR